jgi:hypothetical protein
MEGEIGTDAPISLCFSLSLFHKHTHTHTHTYPKLPGPFPSRLLSTSDLLFIVYFFLFSFGGTRVQTQELTPVKQIL